jgi:addiction module HigA family antidote
LKEKNMEMKNPPHPGELIGDTLDELHVSIVAAAKGLGITRQQLHNVIAGRSGVTPEMAVKLEKAIGSTADTWLRMQMNYDLAQVRKRKINVKRLAPA